jgi:hypothetical protein
VYELLDVIVVRQIGSIVFRVELGVLACDPTAPTFDWRNGLGITT